MATHITGTREERLQAWVNLLRGSGIERKRRVPTKERTN